MAVNDRSAIAADDLGPSRVPTNPLKQISNLHHRQARNNWNPALIQHIRRCNIPLKFGQRDCNWPPSISAKWISSGNSCWTVEPERWASTHIHVLLRYLVAWVSLNQIQHYLVTYVRSLATSETLIHTYRVYFSWTNAMPYFQSSLSTIDDTWTPDQNWALLIEIWSESYG